MYQPLRLPKIKSKIHSPLFLLVVLLCFGIPDRLPKTKLLDLPSRQNPAPASLYAQTSQPYQVFAPVDPKNPERREGAGAR